MLVKGHFDVYMIAYREVFHLNLSQLWADIINVMDRYFLDFAHIYFAYFSFKMPISLCFNTRFNRKIPMFVSNYLSFKTSRETWY